MARVGAFFLGILLMSTAVSAQIPAGQFPPAPGLPQAPARDAMPKTGTSLDLQLVAGL